MSNELIREIEDAVRREQLEKSIKEYGPYVIAGCALAILLTGFMSGYQSLKNKADAAATATLIESLEGPNIARKLSDAAATLDSNHEIIARLMSAGGFLENDNQAEALIQFQQASQIKNAPAILKDMAIVQAVRAEWQAFGKDKDPAALISKLEPIAKDKKNPWQASALMQSAIITAHGLDNVTQARAYLAQVKDLKDKIPPTFLRRAEALDHIFALKENEKADNNKAQD
jgi:hypothetical protein